MKEKTNNYEEAKRIIKNSLDEPFFEHSKKVSKLRATFVAALGVSAAIAAGIATNDPSISIASLPLVALVDSPFLIAVYGHTRAKKQMDNGTYFDGMSEEKVIDLANGIVDQSNAYEEKKGGRSK
jgi:hypothetical protein